MTLYFGGQDPIPDSEISYCGTALLEPVVLYIRDNLTPGQVYDENELAAYITDNFDPDDIFEEQALEAWAEKNGWSRDE